MGYNTQNGYVHRYQNINPGSDGTFTITVSGAYLYANAFILKEGSGSTPSPGDSDGDGMSDSDEISAGTNPNNAASVLEISSVGCQVSGGTTQVTFHWPTVSGKTYALQRAYTLAGGFSAVASGIAGTGGTVEYTITGSNGVRYYRIVVE